MDYKKQLNSFLEEMNNKGTILSPNELAVLRVFVNWLQETQRLQSKISRHK